MEMEIVSVPPASFGKCENFTDEHGNIGGVTSIITPLRLTVLNPDSTKISFGCNWWKSCQTKKCSYCMAGMDNRD